MNAKLIENGQLDLLLGFVKSHIKVEDENENALIQESILAACNFVYKHCDFHCLSPDTFEERFSDWPDINLSAWPLISIQTVKYYDESGNLQTVSASDYAYTRSPKPASIWLKNGVTAPELNEDEEEPIVVTYVSGYADLLPAIAKKTILTLVSHYYENRGSTSLVMQKTVDFSTQAMLDLLRRPKIR